MNFYLKGISITNNLLVSCMKDYVKPTLQDFNSEHIILHVGTILERTSSHITKSIIELCQLLKTDPNTNPVSLIISRYYHLNNKANAW